MFELNYSPESGLLLDLEYTNGIRQSGIKPRVILNGSNTYYTWTVLDCGETKPEWADENFLMTCFGSGAESPDFAHSIEKIFDSNGLVGYRAVGVCKRAKIVLELRYENEELASQLYVENPQSINGQSLPLCMTELRFEGMDFGPEGQYLGAHGYGGWAFHFGQLSELTHEGIPFAHGCVGLAMPLVHLHDPAKQRGIQFEFMLNERPVAWVRPGRIAPLADWCVTWATDRLLEPGAVHHYGGTLKLIPYEGTPVHAIRQWRDTAQSRYGLSAQEAPDWIRRANVIWMNMSPGSNPGFTRLDDDKCLSLLGMWKDMGYTAIYGVAPNKIGPHICSPLDYFPCDEVGGYEAEKALLDRAHQMGFHFYLWVTTVGINRDSIFVKEHPEWFTHRENGDLYCAWDTKPPDYQNSMPDGDPLSPGFRGWLKDQVSDLVRRGYDGIYVDGLCMRGSNHLRRAWPGEARNAVEDQMRDLAEHVRSLGKEVITFAEDASLAAQTTCEGIQGRYGATRPFISKTPYMSKFGYYHGVIGGTTPVDPEPPELIPPEMSRDYLLVRYASLFPGVVCEDCHDDYFNAETRPWTVQSLVAGMIPRTGSQYAEDPMFWDVDDEGSRKNTEMTDEYIKERQSANREFVRLLKFCRDERIIREAPLSIEGVSIEGDAAVFGILRPAGNRAILAVVQFADRSARVKVRLIDPVDIPASQTSAAGSPEKEQWRVSEIMRSTFEKNAVLQAELSPSAPLELTLEAYGFRIFELSAKAV